MIRGVKVVVDFWSDCVACGGVGWLWRELG